MEKLNDLQYLRLSKWKKFLYKLCMFFVGIPVFFKNIGIKIGRFFKNIVLRIKDLFVDLFLTFKNGDYKTRVSYLIFGFGNITRGQVFRGLFFFLFEVLFIFYMIFWGGGWLSKLGTLGTQGPTTEWVDVGGIDVEKTVYHDDSFKILLYGILTIFFIIAFIYTWRINIKQNKIAQEILATGKKLKSGKDDIHSLIDDQFHKTLLALPITGIIIFTVLPIFFMIIIAFTNYDKTHNGISNNLFSWVGFENFNQLVNVGSSSNFSATFGEILGWTLMWAFFATFTNYFLGMLVAIMINKKGIKMKKVWRTILVLTIAIPQFVSLLYVSKLFATDGIVNGILIKLKWIEQPIRFWEDKWLARLMVILINIWIGIPYLMLIATGILMNIPQDLYESARIDGANAWQQYMKITLPYMLFVTGPYLLTSFIGNINNFNVIYLLTTGGPNNPNSSTAGGSAGYTDLLITWLFKITTNDSNYKIAAVIGIMVFVVVAVISLIVYNIMPSTKNEEDFS